MNRFVIVSMTHPALFWSSDEGWTDSDNFEVFSLAESESFDLPMGGQWARLFT